MAQSTMKVRLAESRDIDAITALVFEAMEENPISTYTCPNRLQYPEDMYAAYRASTRNALKDENLICCVATITPPFLDESDDFPVAMAIWIPPSKPENSASFRKFEKTC
jgi:hypothetical protein